MKKDNKISPFFTNGINPPLPPSQSSQLRLGQQRRNNDEMESWKEKALKVSQALLAWLILIIVSPVLILLFGTLLIWKWGVVWLIVKLFKRKFIQGFSSCEAVFAVDRFWESSRSSLGLILELEGSVDVETFREEFRKNVLEYSPNSTGNERPDPLSLPPEENGPITPSISPDADAAGDSSEAAPPASSSSVSDSPYLRPFAKLTQIPVTFCGYYYWQKANYFLIHEHIRQINQPTDELGLKKAASTLMSLPFPNRRPLWEILVYPNYLGTTTVGRGTTCGSALFIRVHHALADSKGLMNILQRMMAGSTDYSLQSVKIVTNDDTNTNLEKDFPPPPPSPSSSSKSPETEQEQTSKTEESKTKTATSAESAPPPPSPATLHLEGMKNLIRESFTSLVFLPLKTFQFTYKAIRVPDGVANLPEEDQQSDSSNASWVPLSDSLIRKVCLSQSPTVSRSVVEMTLFLEGITSRGKHKCLNVPDEKGVQSQQSKCQTCVLIPVPISEEKSANELLSNTRYFVTVKCACISSIQNSASKTTFLRSIHSQFQRNGVECKSHRQVVKVCLRLLSLLPRHILRYLIMSKRWGAGCFIYEQFHLDNYNYNDKEDKKLFGQTKISQIVPLVGLQWTHTLASAATLQWQDGTVIMSLIANSSILGPVSQGNPQDHAERIVKGFPEELERLTDDAEEHGFVSIPIS